MNTAKKITIKALSTEALSTQTLEADSANDNGKANVPSFDLAIAETDWATIRVRLLAWVTPRLPKADRGDAEDVVQDAVLYFFEPAHRAWAARSQKSVFEQLCDIASVSLAGSSS